MTQNRKYEEGKVVNIELKDLVEFQDSPFKVKMDYEMEELIESISEFGILIPLLVRKIANDKYEIISGHRRFFALSQLEILSVPAIVESNMSDEDAIICMIDANLHREKISYSEKAYAYKKKYEAIKRKNGRKKGGQIDHQKGKKTIQIMAENAEESAKKIQRYIKITELIPELLDLLDKGLLSFTPAEQLAYIKKEEQKMFLEAMDYCQVSPSLSQAQRIKKLSNEKKLTIEKMEEILGEVKKGEIQRVEFKNEVLHQFFPKSYTAEMMKKEILELLKKNMR